MKYYILRLGGSLFAALLLINNCGGGSGGGSLIPAYSYSVTSSGVAYDDFNISDDQVKDMALSEDGATLYAALGAGSNGGMGILDLASGNSEIVDTNRSGQAIKLSVDNTTAYVTSGEGGYLSFIKLVDKNVTAELLLGGYADGMAITADGGSAYVAAKTSGVHNVNLASEIHTGTTTLTDNNATNVMLSIDEKTLYISESGAGLTILNLDDNSTKTVATTQGLAYDIDLSSDQKSVYIAAGSAGVDIVKLSSGVLTPAPEVINIPAAFVNVTAVKTTADDKLLFVADSGYDDILFVIDLENSNAVTQVANESGTACLAPDAVEVSPDGTKVYLGCLNGVITVFDLTKVY